MLEDELHSPSTASVCAIKLLGYFNQNSGGICKPCGRHFGVGEQAAARMHFEDEHGWDCLHLGTETTQRFEGLYHYTVYHYGMR
jgi:hypothetical protein